MAEATATTRPTRARAAAAKSAPAKAAPAAKKAAAPAPAESAPTGGRINLTFKHVGDTKNYAKFEVEPGAGCVGQIYAPLGTTEVKAVAYGAAS
jgi:hypothetical protein